MGFIQAVLDEEVDYGFEGGARYKTGAPEHPNGFQEKDSEWKYGRHEFSASFGDIKDDVRDFIVKVFHICRGKRHSFMFKDWNDYQIIDQEIIVGEVGTTDSIQLYKMYSGFGQAYTTRPIQAVKFAIIRDELDNVVDGELNLYTGQFTPTLPWTAGVHTLTCEFYVWVSFEDDYNPMTINSWQANTAKVRLVEDKFDFLSTNVPESWSE